MWLIALLAVLPLVQGAAAAPPAEAAKPARPPRAEWKPVYNVREIPAHEIRRLRLALRFTLNAARSEKRILAEATPVHVAAQEALAARDFNLAWRLLVRTLALYEGLPADESIDAAAALQFELDRRFLAPGTALHPRLEPLFLAEGKFAAPPAVRVWLEDGAGQPAGPVREEKLEQTGELAFSLPTGGLAPGRYHARYTLTNGAGQILASAKRAVWVDAALRGRALALGAAMEELARSGVGGRSEAHALAYETAGVFAGIYSRAAQAGIGLQSDEIHPAAERLLAASPGMLGTEGLDPEADLGLAEKLVAALRREVHPFAGVSGNVRLATKGATWRLFIPDGYDPGKKWPAVLAFHAEESDEGFLMNLIAPQAARGGYFVLAPASYSAGDWNEADAKEAFRLLATLRGVFPLEDRAFLLGAGQGAAAAFRLAWREAKAIAGLAAAGGALRPVPDFDKAPGIPVFYRYGERDFMFTVDEGRPFAAAINYRMGLGEGQLLKGLDRAATLREAVAAAFDFFGAVRAGQWNPPRPGGPVSGSKR
jgi:dienelactone hydrolase